MRSNPSSETRIPLKWVFTLLSASGSALILAMGVAVYAARIESKGNFISERMDSFEKEKREDQRELMTYLRRLDERTSRIEGKLDQ